MVNSRKLLALLAAPLLMGALAQAASAASITFNGSDASGRAASATFNVTGNILTVTLSNTAAADVLVPTDTLQALLWNYTGGPSTLVGTSVALGAGSNTFANNSATPTNETNIGGAYRYSNNAGALGHTFAITAQGLGISNLVTFPGGNFADPNGITGGLISAGDNVTTGNGGISNNTWVKNTLVFNFTGATGLDVSKIANVGFIYGTALTEVPTVPGTGTPPPTGATVPVPAAAWSGMALLAGLGGLKKLRRRA